MLQPLRAFAMQQRGMSGAFSRHEVPTNVGSWGLGNYSIGALLRAIGWALAIVASTSGTVWSAPGEASVAERIYAAAPPRLLQIRTLVADAGRQISNGSGFLVSADGLAITNYHVVSQAALDPNTYRLEYTAADGTQGDVTLLRVDLPNDLALVRVDKKDAPFFKFNQDAIEGRLAKGERLYSMGNPLDLGFTIIEGTYNGLTEHSYTDRIHFSGALNPGMSGGPAVTADGNVIGINVATRRGGQLVSFLVPARFAADLLQAGGNEKAADIKGDVGRQLVAWRSQLYKALNAAGFRPDAFGPYRAPATQVLWFNCWASTNAGATPKPRANVNSTECSSDTSIFVASDLNIGAININHSFVRTVDLNQFQFATYLMQMSQARLSVGGPFKKWYTPQRCHEDFVQILLQPEHPPLRAVWCAQAYRQFEGLYDVSLIVITQDQPLEALVSRLNMQAVGYDDAIELGKRFLEAVQVGK